MVVQEPVQVGFVALNDVFMRKIHFQMHQCLPDVIQPVEFDMHCMIMKIIGPNLESNVD